jgi:hypothetical protein
MNQGTQGYSLTEKTEGRKSRDTVPLSANHRFRDSLGPSEENPPLPSPHVGWGNTGSLYPIASSLAMVYGLCEYRFDFPKTFDKESFIK